MSIKSDLYNYYLNLNLKSTKNKVIIFQSDDWGSQRMPDLQTFNSLQNESWLKIDNCPYTRNDSLENEFDFDNLINLLQSFKDLEGNNPVFTLNMNLFNPDFDKMEKSGYKEYHELNLIESYNRYNSGKVLEKLIKAKNDNLIDLQYHGKQHFHIGEYMQLLKNNEVVKNAAKYGFYGLSFENSPKIQSPFLAAYYPFFNGIDLNLNFKEGVEYFNNIFNYYPKSFIAPVYSWNKELEDYSVSLGCNIIQGLIKKKYSLNKEDNLRKNNKNDRIIQVRNVSFEPSLNQNYDWVNNVARQIEIAFKLNKPAIISTHRLNYISSINSDNSSHNLKLLQNLISLILKKWTNVQFIKTSNLYV